MRRRRVVITDEALRDVRNIRAWIVAEGAPQAARAYVRRIPNFIVSMNIASERGQRRDDLAPGLRLVSFESVMIATRVDDTSIVILRVFHGGQDWQTALQEPDVPGT